MPTLVKSGTIDHSGYIVTSNGGVDQSRHYLVSAHAGLRAHGIDMFCR